MNASSEFLSSHTRLAVVNSNLIANDTESNPTNTFLPVADVSIEGQQTHAKEESCLP